MNILEKIITQKRLEVAGRKQQLSIRQLEQSPDFIRETISLQQALLASETGIISEFKRKSPSKGFINEEADVTRIVPGYAQAGASAASILTDLPFFGGSPRDLERARPLVDIPLLRKDFTIDEYQLFEAKAMGADAILLIAAALTKQECGQLARQAKNLRLEVLLELHEEKELDYINDDVNVIGINNRNLTTFVTDTETSFRLGEQLPRERVRISESGISDTAVVRQLRNAGFNGFLIGENFMRTEDPSQALQQFIRELKA